MLREELTSNCPCGQLWLCSGPGSYSWGCGEEGNIKNSSSNMELVKDNVQQDRGQESVNSKVEET